MKNKKYILIILVVIFSVFFSQHVLALNAKYPSLPGAPTLTDDSKLGEYIRYFFAAGIYFATALASLSFAIGAVGLIMSGDSPEARGNATDRMKGSILGLVLLASSFLIMQTINPALLKPGFTTELPSLPGVVLTDGKNEKPSPNAVSDTSTLAPYDRIKYTCNGDKENNPLLLIQTFPKTSFMGKDGAYEGDQVLRIECDSKPTEIKFASFKMAFETPGIYLFLGSGCSVFMSDSIRASQNNVGEPFSLGIRSIRIVNKIDKTDKTKTSYYGAIFHKEPGLTHFGLCSSYIVNMDSTGKTDFCRPVNIQAGAMDFFDLNINPVTSGAGVFLYSEPYGWDASEEAGFCSIPSNSKNISAEQREEQGLCSFSVENSGNADEPNSGHAAVDMDPIFEDLTKNLIFNYDYIDRPEEYQILCETFYDCPGSIHIQGSFLTGLYYLVPNEESGIYDNYCQTFTESVPNLGAREFMKKDKDEEAPEDSGDNSEDPTDSESFMVIPIK